MDRPFEIPDWVRRAPLKKDTRQLPRFFSWHMFDDNNGNQIDLTTPAKSQGWCGSCWAFATIGALESIWMIRMYEAGLNNQSISGPFTLSAVPDLSEEELVSCMPRVWNGEQRQGSCHGGNPCVALDYIKNNGIVAEASMPYSAGFPCRDNVNGRDCSCEGACGATTNCNPTPIPSSYNGNNKPTCTCNNYDPNFVCPGNFCNLNPAAPRFFVIQNDAQTNECDSDVLQSGTIYWIPAEGPNAGDGVVGDQWKRFIMDNGPIVTNIVVNWPFSYNDDSLGSDNAFGDDTHTNDKDECEMQVVTSCDPDDYPDTCIPKFNGWCHPSPSRNFCDSLTDVGAGKVGNSEAIVTGWHAIVVTGWDDDHNAWIIRNSWCGSTTNPWSKWCYFMLDYESLCIGYRRNGNTGMADARAIQFVFQFPGADSDGDQVADGMDNCQNTPNTTQTDTDGDGIGDVCDTCTDSDNDGFKDPGTPGNGCSGLSVADNCPSKSNSSQSDDDNDGLGNACDGCDDDPDVSHQSSSQCDNDQDGKADKNNDNCPSVPNPDQKDSDKDGLGDACDVCDHDPDLSHKKESDCDSDDDGVPDVKDNCKDGPSGKPSQVDSDGDGLGDVCDPCVDDPNDSDPELCDSDGDGIADYKDNCKETVNPSQSNADNDEFGDDCEACDLDPVSSHDTPEECDDDQDGTPNVDDNCPYLHNDQTDSDGDDIGDDCDPCAYDPYNVGDCDDDLDLYPNVIDNCPLVANEDQTDTDGDGIGDACDDCETDSNPAHQEGKCDDDGDGVLNTSDNCKDDPNPDQADADGDELGDCCDVCPGDPDPEHQWLATCDNNQNGVPDIQEPPIPDTDDVTMDQGGPDVGSLPVPESQESEGKGCSMRPVPASSESSTGFGLLLLLAIMSLTYLVSRRPTAHR